MTDKSDYPTEKRAVLRKKTGFLSMWRNVICEFKDGELKLHQGLSENIDRIVKITPSVRISFYADSKHNKFLIEEDGKDPILLAAENTYSALEWIQMLRGETYKSDTLSLDNFDIISTIGRGYYGKVLLVSKKDSKELFALKCVKKSYLAECGKMQTIMSERNILFKANNPFITRIKFAFQSPSKFFIGMEYVSGGELFHLLENEEALTIKDARFYISELAVALDYLHSIGVVYRDLKLENVLIAGDGHVKLCDFGLSKELSACSGTSTFCGTTEYIAPELALGKEYDTKIDWWALGILTYELLYGETPFYADTNAGTLHAIVNDQPEFTSETPDYVKDFINRLLTKDPMKRPTLQDIMDHPFWGGIKWDDVKSKKLKPPFVPPSNNGDIVANFDPEFTNEPVNTDSMATPVTDISSEFTGFSLSEDSMCQADASPSTGPKPSSILTLDLIPPI